MKTGTILMIALGLATIGTGCKKKNKDEAAGGSAMTKTNEGSGSATATPEPVKPTPKTGKDLADSYVACMGHINEGKLDDFKTNCLSTDFVSRQADMPGENKLDAVMGWFQGMRTSFPDWKLEPQLVMVNGRNILSVVLMTGTHQAPMQMPGGPEIPATNKKVGQLFFHRLAINDENKATEEWVYYDPTTMMGQLGLMPKEAPPVRPAMEKGIEGAPVILVTADDEKEQANLALAKKSDETFNSHKVADIMAMWADDAVESDQAGGMDHKGKKEIEKGMKTFFKAFSDVKVASEHTFAAGDYVVALGTFSGTNDGPLGPMKKTGKPVTGSYAEIYKIADGKIAELWRFRNGMAMAVQLGLMPDPSKAGAPGGEPAKDDAKADKKAAPAKKGT